MNKPPHQPAQHRSSDPSAWIAEQPTQTAPIEISVVIPAFNEALRLPPTLIDIIDYFDRRGGNYEIIVVDDGSSDETSLVVQKFERIRTQMRQILLPENRGKGHAVRLGVLNAHGSRILFCDADGSTPIAEVARLESALNQGADLAIGSRAKASAETAVKALLHRRLIGRIFNSLVNLLAVPEIQDTQCGFKLFSAKAARFLFERQRADGYSFDVELLHLAQKAGLKIQELPVNWHNVPGSKVNLVLDSARMLADLIRIRVRHRQIGPADWLEYKAG